MNKIEILKDGVYKNNPVFVQLLGLCPTLAVTNSLINGLAMGLATMFVLICSNLLISLLRRFILKEIRIASYIVIIATFVTIVDIFFKANFLTISKALGPFIPLIIVNCLILARAESFASSNNIFNSLLDAISMGTGFCLSLLSISFIRELLGQGTIFIIIF
jgi:Na+-translocating ferredoxin:NAD+ oxidoreductase subunit E